MGCRACAWPNRTAPFHVELQKRADGAQCADLVLLQELDRESQAADTLELVALDGGRPLRSATAVFSVLSWTPMTTARPSRRARWPKWSWRRRACGLPAS